MGKTKGGFTLPGESGYEKLTLEMAEKWGADYVCTPFFSHFKC